MVGEGGGLSYFLVLGDFGSSFAIDFSKATREKDDIGDGDNSDPKVESTTFRLFLKSSMYVLTFSINSLLFLTAGKVSPFSRGYNI